ncbi:hypothetical protein [Clostridium sp. MD294]|uniref:hypothetical protein n=1 Tax=Clostridium sp. MD294 TaxID=97138 RepID=UPI0002CC5599|nr:hypothetical protein [Clostridium sp. MD294]NDO46488.1 hypothetical protein [Clostridium sp. MD294]USF29082.1 hypothetical protein C820_000465 [Clostridium sp. MD294]
MRKYIFIIVTICFLFVLMICNKNDTKIMTSGIYKMKLSQEQQNSEKVAPTISIDTKQKSFIFCYDALSYYMNIGIYKINDNILTCTTSDDKYHYIFEMIDENTLCFLEEQSSKITIFDTTFGVVPQNGAIFEKIEK